jgi:acetylornithine/succinyldiaminopimelate/putrescine aminotransferase
MNPIVLTAEEAKALEDRYQLATYAKLPIVVDRGRGCYVWDAEGRQYLDMYGGHCVTSTGHSHPKVVEAIARQAANLIFYSNATYSTVRAKAVEQLLQLCRPFAQVFLVNSGAEANENAIKLARAVTGRREVLSAAGAFHGRTYGALSATGIEQYRRYLNPAVPDHRIVEADAIPEAVSTKTAAVLMEPIQSMGGVVVLDPELLRQIESACSRHGALLIFDEIQTGVGRTGRFLYSQKIGVTPSMTSLAKGIASGFPVGALLVTEDVAKKVKKGDLGSTFGGSPLACAAMSATLEVYEAERLGDNAARMGELLRRRLGDRTGVREVRGEGLLLGLAFESRTAKEVQTHLFQRGVLAGTSNDPDILRLMPALTMDVPEVNRFLEALEGL